MSRPTKWPVVELQEKFSSGSGTLSYRQTQTEVSMHWSRSCSGAGFDWSGFSLCQTLVVGGEAADAAGMTHARTSDVRRANSNETRFIRLPPSCVPTPTLRTRRREQDACLLCSHKFMSSNESRRLFLVYGARRRLVRPPEVSA